MSAPERNEQRTSQQEDVIEEGVRKRTRRMSSYWWWFREIGCKKFRHMHGRDYDEDRVEDRKLVTELWDLEKESWSMVEQHGTPSAPSHKDRSDQNFPDIKSKWLEPQSRAIEAASTSLPSTSQPYTTCNLQQRSASAKRMFSKRDFSAKLMYCYFTLGLILSTASQKYQVSRPICLGRFPCFELQFVLINPFIVAPSVNDGILVYPAEISITHFTFERGAISCWSSLINFDPNILEATRHRFHQSTVEENAMLLGVPVKSAQGRYPCEVWRTFVTKCHNHGTVVCDADQMEILDGALYFLASTVGPHQLQIHAEIMDKMITIQDFISALGCVYYDVIEKRLPRYLTDESIDRQFTNARQIVLESLKCCDYHDSKPPNHESRQHCTVARTAVLIGVVYRLCFSGNLLNFRDFCDPEKHSMSTISVNSPSFQTGCTMSNTTEDVPRDERAEANLDASDYLEEQSYALRYQVVPPKRDPFVRQPRVEVELRDSISRLMRIGFFRNPF